jgi:hypothetical protein
MPFGSMLSLMKVYSPIWNKYRPAILKMMRDSAEAPQTYSLSAHEFRALNARQKGGYTFVLMVSKGKVVNDIRGSGIAQDLLEVLQLSKSGSELMGESPFEITMDKHFILHVTKIKQENTTPEVQA